MSSLFNELKRRNVIRVAVTYVVAAWVLLQIGDVLIGMLELPGWIGKALVLMLALLFPIVLIFAWAFELTPEGLKADADVKTNDALNSVSARKLNIVTIALVIVALSIFAIDRILHTDRSENAPVTAMTVAAPLDASVAVLPFANISQDAANEPFTIGIHDDLLTQIAKIGSLKTISRTSVLPYKNTTKPLKQVAAELGVATILEGGVQRAGDQVRINVQLIDAQSNAQLWAERYERQLTAANIFVIQSEIVKAIASALQANLSIDERSEIEKIPTENLEALELFFLGRERLESRNTIGIRQATDYFEQAIALDPGFALAYVGLADSYQIQEDAGSLGREEMLQKAGDAIGKALELDSQLGAAYSSLGGLQWTVGDYPEAEAMFRKSLELSPNYSRAYLWYGLLLVDWGRTEEAIPIYKSGIERDPLSSVLTESLGYALELQGQFLEAQQNYQRSAAMSSGFSTPYYAFGRVLWMASGGLSQAIACLNESIDRDRGARIPRTYLGLLYLDLGDVSRAETWIGSALQLAPSSSEASSAMALLNYYLGKDREAYRHAATAQLVNPYYQEARLLQTMALAVMRNTELKAGKYSEARALYEDSHAELLTSDAPVIDSRNYRVAIDLAYVLLKTGETDRATRLLEQSLAFIKSSTAGRLGIAGYGIGDVQIFALLGEREKALAALREAVDQQWRGFWWFRLKNNPNLESLHDNGDFQSMVKQVETRMVAQRALLNPADSCGIH